eukprot:TRINITY_DN9080_c1_g1_i1.p1 TRINITY_DN9080_c1_g1~~TRINITY_DN9080_c1_g1_i1.p1  ORF type:complete len:471 (+),score=103.67 TRINITY_DN9080_c1_g1_i1:37-1449(+)
MLKCRVCGTIAKTEHYSHSCVMPPAERVEEEPPERAVDASSSRGDVCAWKDETEVFKMANGHLEMYTSSHWVGRILQIRPVEGRVLLGRKSKRTWTSGLLKPDAIHQLEGLVGPSAATPTETPIQPSTPPSEDGAQDDGNTPHASPPTTPSAIARRRSVSVKGIKVALAGLSLGSLSPFSKKKRKAAAAAAAAIPDPYNSPKSVSEPNADDLRTAVEEGTCSKITLENEVKVCLCRSGRIELFVNGRWQHPITKVTFSGEYENRTLVMSNGNRTVTRTIDDHAHVEKLVKIMRICERAGINSDMREHMQDVQLDAVNEVPPPPIITHNEEIGNNHQVLMAIVSSGETIEPAPSAEPSQQPEGEEQEQEQEKEEEDDLLVEELSGTPPPQSPPPVSIPENTIWPYDSSRLPPSPASDEEPSKPECLVCFSEEKNVVFFPCRHLCSCKDCSMQLRDCPLCRTAIIHRVQIFT